MVIACCVDKGVEGSIQYSFVNNFMFVYAKNLQPKWEVALAVVLEVSLLLNPGFTTMHVN